MNNTAKPLRRLLLPLMILGLTGPLVAEPIQVVTTLPVYAAVAREVGGERLEVRSISRGDEDAHFVKPKPSFALMLRRADLFVTSGLDLELWAPVLIDKSGNRAIREGAPGYVSASRGVPLLDIPASPDRSAGDVHIYGNPHFLTNPLNVKIVAANITAGLARVDPPGAAAYEAGREHFSRHLDEALYGAELLGILGAEVLDPLARQGGLLRFLGSQEYQGRPLIERLGGWLGRARPLRGRRIVAYHKNWIYFAEVFGLELAGYVEPKPGIPPSARHVHRLIEQIREEHIEVLLAASYFSARQVETIAERTGCRPVRVPLGPVEGGPADYFTLVDLWIEELLAAATARESAP